MKVKNILTSDIEHERTSGWAVQDDTLSLQHRDAMAGPNEIQALPF